MSSTGPSSGAGRQANGHPGPIGSEGSLDRIEIQTGRTPGTRYVRIVRPGGREFQQQAPGHLVVTERVLEPHSVVGRVWEVVRSLLIGPRIPSEREMEERAGKLKALAIFASDNISSSAYATEEVMRVLAPAAALGLTMPITLGIVLILGLVVLSYREVIHAYPNGGGSYVVARENLGPLAGLTAAAALLTDYVLTVAVSISAGIAALTSAFPQLLELRVGLSILAIALMAVLNLRGIRESGNVFAAPTYMYLGAILGLIGLGLVRAVAGGLPAYAPPAGWAHPYPAEPLTLLLVLRAFSSGSVALTGTEAVSNGVPAFKPPEARNAQIVLVAMGALFATIFLGVSLLASQMGIVPDPDETETVVSQLARALVGEGPYYYLVQFSTAVLLLLAANTAFNGFPRLASILAKDRYLPRQFLFRGERLAFSAGIIVLAILAAALVIAYGGSVTGLIPLYTVGVFLAFTLSQIGMVRHWLAGRATQREWRARAAANTVGACATGIVLVVVAVSKFALGAWIVLVLIPLLIAMMRAISHHYQWVEDILTPPLPHPLPVPPPPEILVPISRIDEPTLNALRFARSIPHARVTAIHVTDDWDRSEELRIQWDRWRTGVPLLIVESRQGLLPGLLAYIDACERRTGPGHPLMVLIAELAPRSVWEFILHSETVLRLKVSLFFRPHIIVADVPYFRAEAGSALYRR